MFINLAEALYYPKPYYSNDNLWTLEQESWYYYKNFIPDIRHEKIESLYTVDVSGNPVLQSNGVENSYGTVLINASDYPIPWLWYEAEGGNVKRVGTWEFVTDTAYSNSTYINGSVIGDYVEFEFVGSGFSIIWRRCTACGYIDVYINDTLFTQIDTYGTVGRYSTGIYFSQTDIPVNIKLKISPTKNPSSTGNLVQLDAFKMGSSRYRVYLHDKLKFPDGKYYITAPGSATSNYLISYHYLGTGGWASIYNQTFYILLKNPTSSAITFGIADHSGLYDYITGTAQTTAGKIYCLITVPPNTDWTLYKLNTSSPECALTTNSTHAGMRRTFYYPGVYGGWIGQGYRLFANASGLLVDSFWVAFDREIPKIIIKNALTGEDLSNGGYIDCESMNSTVGKGINITVTNLPPNSGSWRIRIIASPNLYDYVLVISPTLTADSTGKIVWNNVVDTSRRLCKDYDYANFFTVYVDNIAVPGTTGSSFVFQSPPIIVMPWNWAFPDLKIINLATGKEEYILKPNTKYKVIVNFTNTSGFPISSGVTIYFSFSHMYGTEGVKGGFENPILLDGTTSFILWSDRTFTLTYNSTSKLWERTFITPSEWKYDGHFSTLRLRIINNTNSLYRFRYSTWQFPNPVMFVLFSNHIYSGKGIDVIAKDIDFGTSWAHPFYTTSGGQPPTFNDGNNDVWIEDREKVILIYNSTPGKIAQTPIIYYIKSNGLAYYTSGGGPWAPGYSYLGTYKQSRIVYTDFGLSKDYAVVILQESNALGYVYNVTLYIPANSDWIEAFFDLPDITTLDYTYQTFNFRIYGFRTFFENIRYLETLYGREEVKHFWRPFTCTGMTWCNVWAFSNVTAKAPNYYLGFTTSIPMPTNDG
ncbi:MAG TPA: hypothetical protein ENO30_03195, partial [Thermodesulfobium narugense]|nr:hypothetical protein [Thermodesulfobium narugense]